MNLVNMAMKYVGPMVAERIASKLGIGGPVVNKLIAAALPALLGSFIGKSQTETGLGGLMDLVTGANKPDANALESMFDGGGDVDALAQSGGGMLEGLLGAGGLSSLAGALGQHAGVESNQAGSLLGMLAPVALGTISNQVSEQGLDGPGLASFLQGQAGNVAEAMPSGFASQLEGTGLLDGLSTSWTDTVSDAAAAASGAVSSAASAAGDVAGGVASAAGNAAESVTSAAGDAAGNVAAAAGSAADAVQAEAKKSMGVLPWILGVLALVLLGWFFLGGSDAPEMDASAIADQLKVGDVDVGGEFGSLTTSLTDTFKGITDQASAEAALPQLEDISGQLGSLSETAGQLPDAAKSGFQSIVATALEQLRPIIETAVSSSGAGGILQPIVDQILGALEGMAG